MTTWEEWAKSVTERFAAIEQKLATIEQTLKWHEQRTNTAFEQINKLRDELVETLFLPQMQVLIVNELKTGDKTQQQISRKLPDFISHPMVYHGFYRAWERFEKHKVIEPISRGRGHLRLWHLTILSEQEVAVH